MISNVACVIQALKAQFPGTATFKGIRPPPLPDSALTPFVTVQEVSGKELENLLGKSGQIRSLIQVNVWSKDYEEASVCRDIIRNYLLGFTGNVMDSTIYATNHAGDRSLYDGTRELHQLVTSFMIWFGS